MKNNLEGDDYLLYGNITKAKAEEILKTLRGFGIEGKTVNLI